MTTYDSRLLDSGLILKYWSRSRIIANCQDNLDQVGMACRLNILSSIKCAGSGHIGTSFSAIDIMLSSYKYIENLLNENRFQNSIFFSSKGHDAPALYAALHSIGKISDDQLFSLRRLDGLPGHPEIGTPGVPTNTGSLGMGISKAKGFIHGNRLSHVESRVIVLLGDGELQEGQIWESMATAARDKMSELVVIVDANGIQSDTWVKQINPYENLEQRVIGSGWLYYECDGHNSEEIIQMLTDTENLGTPVFIKAKTVKGFGISVFEDFPNNGEFYKFHSGSVSDELYDYVCNQLLNKLSDYTSESTESKQTQFENPYKGSMVEYEPYSPKIQPYSMVSEWAVFLNEMMSIYKSTIILDADLSYDTGTYIARNSYPDRYIQCGIAEQDMVSMAGTLALSGFKPLVHSFATFLTMRATEQIFNNATEKSSIVYLGFLAGLLPSAPGFSHQAVNDVAIMNAIPGMRIYEPACADELIECAKAALENSGPAYIRVGSVGMDFQQNDEIKIENLRVRRKGDDILLLTSGPLLTSESLKAAKLLTHLGKNTTVATLPVLNASMGEATLEFIGGFREVYILENFIETTSLFTAVATKLPNIERLMRIGLSGIPRNGRNDEVLKFHKLDAESISEIVQQK